MKRSTIAKTFTITALTALALGIGPRAKAADRGCSNATLKGTFAYTSTGSIAAPPEVAGPFVEVVCKPSTGGALLPPPQH